MASGALSPALFDAVVSEADALQSGKRGLDDPIGKGSDLLEFVQEVFSQIFRAELGIEITGFTQTDKEEALFIGEKVDPDSPIAYLLDLYVDICNMWPDVLSPYYGGTATDFMEFRSEVMPLLLKLLQEYVSKLPNSELVDRVRTALAAYRKAIATAAGAHEPSNS